MNSGRAPGPGPSAPSDPLPADPLHDHRHRHIRPLRQQPPDQRLGRIHHRTLRRPHVFAAPRPPAPAAPCSGPAPASGQSPAPACRPPGSAADLRPVLHVDHFPSIRERVHFHRPHRTSIHPPATWGSPPSHKNCGQERMQPSERDCFPQPSLHAVLRSSVAVQPPS